MDIDFDLWKERVTKEVVAQGELFNKIFSHIQANLDDKLFGFILDGPPGVGKTHIGDALAKCSGLPYKCIGYPDIMDDPLQYIQDVIFDWECGKERARIIVLEDLDSILPTKVEVSEQTEMLKTFAAVLDRIVFSNFKLIIFGLCEDVKECDESFIKCGHFKVHIPIQVSTWEQRRDLLMYFSGKELDFQDIALRTPGFSPRDLQSLLNEPDIGTALQLRKITPSIMTTANTSIPVRSTSELVGLDDIIFQCKELLTIPLDPRCAEFGVRAPRGLLLYGLPGSGKSHLAMALARESGLNYHYMEASQMRSKYIGQSEKQIAGTFAMARKAAPCILLIDHLQNLLPNRSNKDASASSLRIVTCFLTEIDGIESQSEKYPVTVIAMAESKEGLDPAIIRAGRIEFHFELPATLSGQSRKDFLKKRVPEGALVPLGEEQINELLRMTEGYTGADMEYLWKEAAVSRLRRSCEPLEPQVEWFDLMEAVKFLRTRVTNRIKNA